MTKGKISFTAWVVVVALLWLHGTKRWGAMVQGDAANFYRTCVDYCAQQSSFFRLMKKIPMKVHAHNVEFMLAKGGLQHFACRKAAIAAHLQEAVTQGARQCVVLGGGFDLLAYNNALSNPQMVFFEIDTPDMHAHKMQLLGRQPGNFIGIGVDLGKTSLYDIVSQHPRFDKTLPTVFIAEGVSMYLSPEAFAQLLIFLRKLNANARFIFTAIPTRKKTTHWLGTKLNKLLLAFTGEKFSFTLPEQEMGAYLGQHGFALKQLTSYADLQRPWRTADEMDMLKNQNGEYLVYAAAL